MICTMEPNNNAGRTYPTDVLKPFDPGPFSAGRYGSARGAERESFFFRIRGPRQNASSRLRYIDLLCRGVVKRSGGVHSAAGASAGGGGSSVGKGPCGVDAADGGCFEQSRYRAQAFAD